jgi:arylsulfatase A-like enzyme
MVRRNRALVIGLALVGLVLAAVGRPANAAAADERPPNIVYIMSDELAYYELSHMGNPRIHTPRIDRMAAEGVRFTQALAGSPVCAPLRCTLMTGKHAGHASVRANDGGTPLRADEPTIASMLKRVGYATGGFGKWGCGGRDSTGVPEKHGFDVFFGYYDQVHAHSFYPPYLIRNSEEVELAGNSGGRSGQTYSHYVIVDEAIKFIRANKDRPFFCYLPITPPHGMYDIPADDPAWEHYRDADWIKDPEVPQDANNYAAMVTMVDRNVGQVLDLLKELNLEDNTIVFFTGDNGGQDRFRNTRHPRGYFGPNVHPKTGVEFRGGKGNLYEGGLRIPFIVRWPGKILPGRVSHLPFYQPDVLPTLAELTGAKAPADVDGLSILPELIGAEAAGRKQQKHEFLYWEYRSQVAVRMDHWKAIQPKRDAPWELYDLEKDVSETTDVANQHPDILARMKAFAEQSHVPVQPGTFQDRTRHERDRKAKWGSTGAGVGSSRVK